LIREAGAKLFSITEAGPAAKGLRIHPAN